MRVSVARCNAVAASPRIAAGLAGATLVAGEPEQLVVEAAPCGGQRLETQVNRPALSRATIMSALCSSLPAFGADGRT